MALGLMGNRGDPERLLRTVLQRFLQMSLPDCPALRGDGHYSNPTKLDHSDRDKILAIYD
jgi:hypothetical protein